MDYLWRRLKHEEITTLVLDSWDFWISMKTSFVRYQKEMVLYLKNRFRTDMFVLFFIYNITELHSVAYT